MSELRADTITASDGTSPVTLTGQTAAKAHGLTDQKTGGTQTLRTSFNVSSISDGGTGLTDYSLTSSMSISLYTVVLGVDTDLASYSGNTMLADPAGGNMTSSVVPVKNCETSTGGDQDQEYTSMCVMGDLA